MNLQEFKIHLNRILDLNGFVGTTTVFQEVEKCGFPYSKNTLADLRNDATQNLAVLTPANFVAKLRNFIETIGQASQKQTESHLPKFLTSPPFQAPVFIGRQEELQAVHDRLFTPNNNFLMLVNGHGGIGKTTFASKYWEKYQHEYTHLAFLYVENGIANGILSLAGMLGLKFSNETIEQQLDILITTVINLAKPCLLILDNANHEKDLNENIMLLRRCTNFHILLTSRLANSDYAEKYPLGTLSKEQALEVFKKHYPLLEESEKTLFAEVYDAVGGNTLVLELLAKNLSNFNNKLKKRYTLQNLLDDIQQNLLQLSLSKEVNVEYQAKGTGIRNETPEAIILAMYDLTDLTEDETALLSVLSVLPAENIAFDMLTTLLQDENLDTPLLSLAQKGWIEYNETEASFKISPVVQEITRHKNQERLFDDCTPLIKNLTNLLRADYEQYHLLFKWLPYTATLRTLFATQTNPIMAKFQNNLAMVLQALGGEANLLQAKLLLEKALQTYIKHLGEDTPTVASMQSNLATVLQALGGEANLLQAKLLLEKALQTNIKQFGEDAPTVAIRQSNLAMVLRALGGEANLLQAKLLLEKALQTDIKHLGEDTPTVASMQSNLALVLQALGGEANLRQAKLLLEKALQTEIKQFGEDAPAVAVSQSNLALVLKDLGGEANLLQAKLLIEKALQIHIKQFGEDAPTTASIQSNLATVLQDLGGEANLLQAKILLEKALQTNIKQFGEDAPSTAISQSCLAAVLKDLGGEANLLQAKLLVEKALQTHIKQFGEDAPSTAISQSCLAAVLKDLGGEANLLQAKLLNEKALQTDIKQFGEDAPTVAIRQNNLANVLKALGGEAYLLQAKLLLEKALQTAIKQFGEDARVVATRQSNLALVLQALGGEANLLQAKLLLEKAYAICKKQFSSDENPYTRGVLDNLFALFVLMTTGEDTNTLPDEEMEVLEPKFREWLGA